MAPENKKSLKPEEIISSINSLYSHLGINHSKNINTILEYVHNMLGGMCAIYNRMDDESKQLVTFSGYNLPKGFDRFHSPEGCICFNETMKNFDRPTVIEDLNKTPYAQSDPVVKKYMIRSYLGFPVLLDGDPRGTLCIIDSRKRQFTGAEVDTMAILAKAISIEENRRRDEETLRDSEERLKIMYEYAPDAYYLSDLNGVFIDGNKAAEDMLGVNKEDFIGNNYFDLDVISPDQFEKAAELLQMNLDGLPTGPDEFILNRKDRTKVNTEIRTYPVNIKGQNIALGIVRDITQRKEAQAALLESEKMLSQIVQGNSIATFVLNKDHKITHWNRACENLTGFSADEMIGTDKQWAAFYPEKRPVMADMVLAGLSEKELRKFYGRRFRLSDVIEGGLEAGLLAKTSQGDTWLHCTAAPIKEPDGKTVGAMETLQDVTGLIKAQEELEKARNELEHKVQERTINLEEANTALKVLLQTKDEAHLQIEETILFNINELVAPYIEKLKIGKLSMAQLTDLEILEANLNDITSSFSHRMSTLFLKLTPTEIQVANFIKQGRTSKEIANMLNLSIKTIETHRKNIRSKIGIKNQKSNLRTYLLSLQ